MIQKGYEFQSQPALLFIYPARNGRWCSYRLRCANSLQPQGLRLEHGELVGAVEFNEERLLFAPQTDRLIDAATSDVS